MTPERYKEVGQLYRAALEVEPERRAVFLAEACSGDETLRQEVESLFDYEAQRGGLIDQPALEVAAQTLANEHVVSPVGQSVGHYQILSLLGKGGMGEVYRARDTKLDRTVALKILPAELAADHDRMRRFVREAKAASALNHPHVATIYEIGEADGISFIAMEYIEGQTLAAVINGHPLDPAKIIEIGIQVADALDEAHSKGITHRDIKPANLMLTPRGQVKVLDFGLAKVAPPAEPDEMSQLSTLTQTTPGVVMGTVAYMSPEQALGREVDHRTDILSLGVALYEMATGQRPFRGATASETIDRILHAQPEAIAHINDQAPAELERIVGKCLEKEREQRYQSARSLMDDLKRFQQEDHQTRPASVDISATKDRQQSRARGGLRRVQVVLALVALGVAAAAGGWMFRHNLFSPRSEIGSLAVLPLKNIGGDAQDEYLSDGITDELITKLTKLKGMRVVSLPVVLRFKNSAKDAVEIGRDLGVDAVLYGTVRKAGSRFRVSVHLVNTKDGFEVWADSDFEHELRDLLDAERQLAEAVAARLKGQLTAQERAAVAKKSTVSVEAYEFLLRGKERLRRGPTSQPIGDANEQNLARQMFEHAIMLDSNFADAYALLALTLYYQFHDGNGLRATLNDAINRANKALELDPNLITARQALIHIYHSTGQNEEGLWQAKRVLESAPDDFDAVAAAALAYFRAGMMDRAIPLYQKAVSLNPLDPGIRSEYARCYIYTGEYQKGLDALSPILAQKQGGEWVAMWLYRELGQFDKAIENGRRLLFQASRDA